MGRLQTAAAARKPGYIDAHMKAGKIVQIRGMPFMQLSDPDYSAIGKQFALVHRRLSSTASGASLVSSVSSAVKPPAPKASSAGGGLGDAIHKVAGPIGRAIKWPCMKHDGTTDLIPGSPCDRARKLLNKL